MLLPVPAILYKVHSCFLDSQAMRAHRGTTLANVVEVLVELVCFCVEASQDLNVLERVGVLEKMMVFVVGL